MILQTLKTAACVLCAAQAFPLTTAFAQAPSATPAPVPVQSKSGSGIRSLTFTLARGRVLVVLPEDIAAGDTFSATITAYPKDGQDLSRFSVRIGDITTPVPAGVVVSTLPGTGQSGAGELFIALLDETGAEAGRTKLRIPSARTALPGSAPLPKNGNPGQPVVIRNRFDGNISTTRVLVDGTSVPILAESPRTLVFLSPPASSAKTEIEVREGDQTVRGEFRSEKQRRQTPWGTYLLVALGVTALAITLFLIELGNGIGDGFNFPG